MQNEQAKKPPTDALDKLMRLLPPEDWQKLHVLLKNANKSSNTTEKT